MRYAAACALGVMAGGASYSLTKWWPVALGCGVAAIYRALKRPTRDA